MPKKFLILGGTGNTGSKIADLLLSKTNSKVIIASRSRENIDKAVRKFKNKYNTDNIDGRVVDAADRQSLIDACINIDLVVVASGTAQYVNLVAQAALEANVDYLDIQYSSKKIAYLKQIKQDIKKSKRLFITDAGFHPGLPAVLIRHGANKLEEIKSANVYGAIRQDWQGLSLNIETKVEFVKELANFEPLYFKNGEWKKASMVTTRDFKKIDFGFPIGIKTCTPMSFEELKSLPTEISSLQNMGFYIAGFNWFIDMILMPISLVLMKMFKNFGAKSIAKIMFWSLERNSKAPFNTVLQLNAIGKRRGQSVNYLLKLSHKDGYWFTAIPVVACLQQYIKDKLPKTGLWCMGNAVRPGELLLDMSRLGILIEESNT